jgi:hypothetical protein
MSSGSLRRPAVDLAGVRSSANVVGHVQALLWLAAAGGSVREGSHRHHLRVDRPRSFRHGRTEAMRVVTPEVPAFVTAMDDPAATDEQRAASAAARAAVARAVRQSEGMPGRAAPERHFWALQMLQQRRGAALGVTAPLASTTARAGWSCATTTSARAPSRRPGSPTGIRLDQRKVHRCRILGAPGAVRRVPEHATCGARTDIDFVREPPLAVAQMEELLTRVPAG